MPGATVPYTQRFFALLELLKRESDADHRFQQTALAEALEEKNHMPVDRRSVKKALDEMQKAGYPVIYDKGWYYDHEFSPTELRYLGYSVRCNNTLPPEQQELLLDKIAQLGSKWYNRPDNASILRTSNEHFLDNLAVLNAAIDEGIQVEFSYGDYDVDFRLHERLNRAGNKKLYVVNPYQIATVNGRYYLIANVNKYDGLSHYRIDRIIDAKKIKKKIKPLSMVTGQASTLNLPQYMAEHPYMYSGEPHYYRIRTKRSGINDVLDWFGKNVRFENVDDKESDVIVKSDSASLEFWLKRYEKQAHFIQEEGTQ